MKMNDLETLVENSFLKVEKDLEAPVIEWVTERLNQFKKTNKIKKVEMITGMGTWCYKVNGESYYHEYSEEKYDASAIIEIDETLKLLAGQRNIYLMKDITV
jgi:hypothetical protein